MAEGKVYTMVAPEVYEMSLIKGETPGNPIALTIKQTQKISTLSGTVVEILKKKCFDCIQKQVKTRER